MKSSRDYIRIALRQRLFSAKEYIDLNLDNVLFPQVEMGSPGPVPEEAHFHLRAMCMKLCQNMNLKKNKK
jgi:hypothetical protein